MQQTGIYSVYLMF